jgi:outer membrane protein assembly factor BamD (BamD/ComL family)
MSVTGIAASSIFSFLHSASAQANYQDFQKEFQQLGQDLSSGNLSAAQADFQALETPTTGSSSTQNSGNSLSRAMQQLASDLQSGNVQGAQQDYATVKQDLQQTGSGTGHHHHHHRVGSAQDSSQNPIDQLLAQLGQALQSGNVTAAQGAYSSLQQDFAALSGTTGTSTPVSVSA